MSAYAHQCGGSGGGGGGEDLSYLKQKLEAKKAELAELKRQEAETAAKHKQEQLIKRKQTRHNQSRKKE